MDEDANNVEVNNAGDSGAKKNSSMVIFGVVLALAVVGVVLFAKMNQKNKMVAGDSTQVTESQNNESMNTDADGDFDGDEAVNSNPSDETAMSDDQNSGDTVATDTSTGEIQVEGGMYYFKPNTITVKKGTPVKITFKNVEGIHDFVIDELNVHTKQIRGGQTDTVEFTPDKTGSFEFYCSVGNHRQMGMKGTLVVQ